MNRDIDMKLNCVATLKEVVVYTIDYEENKENWQTNYFKLMSVKNTYSGCRELTINSTRHSEQVWVHMVVDKDKEDAFTSWTNELYKNVKKSYGKALIYDEYELINRLDDSEDDLSYVFVE